MTHHATIEDRYLDALRDRTIVASADRMLGDERRRLVHILQSLQTLLRRGIRVALVYGEGQRLHTAMVRARQATRHPETNKLVVNESGLERLQKERRRIHDRLLEIAGNLRLPVAPIDARGVTLERRVGHRQTGAIRAIEEGPIRQSLEDGRLALVGFLGQAEDSLPLYVPAETLAAELAVRLGADKLMLLDRNGCLLTRSRSGARRVSFLDMEQLLCLLRRVDQRGRHVVHGPMVATLHSAIRAVAGGVSQTHVVSERRILAELTTRTGAGTLIEWSHTHTLQRAGPEDVEEIVQLHEESTSVETERGTPLVVPLSREELVELLPHTFVLKHRGVVIGKLHAPPMTDDPSTVAIGGYCVGESHQDWQHGRLLLEESLERLFLSGAERALAVTASDRAARSLGRFGAEADPDDPRWRDYLAERRRRYAPSEQKHVRLFVIPLAAWDAGR